MNALREWIAGPAGPYIAILAMTVVTYVCRASGVILMSRVQITPRIESALRALPGSIVVATILPIAFDGGASAILGLSATIIAMSLTRQELVALAAGLGTVAALRAFGF
jgi:uncharacterized membrane protein